MEGVVLPGQTPSEPKKDECLALRNRYYRRDEKSTIAQHLDPREQKIANMLEFSKGIENTTTTTQLSLN